MRKVLIANRGEIAVRIIRACKDAGLASVAVYAEPDLDALHVTMADEAYALEGQSAAESYLSHREDPQAGRRLRRRRDPPGLRVPGRERRVRPGGDRRRAHLDRAAARGDRRARRQGRRAAHRGRGRRAAGAGHRRAGQRGRRGGGVRRRVRPAGRHQGRVRRRRARAEGGARGRARSPRCTSPRCGRRSPRSAAASASWSVTWNGRGTWRRSAWPTSTATVVVVSTRDCSLQRRHQKLVEEAPAPFLTDAQQARLYEASKAILREAGYAGAGTCEFLVGQDGTVSFLEVNTRLQVEHPVSEEVTGLDLVREMFRIADGQRLGFGDPQVRGHSIEFRINAEDAGRNFLPAPGTITRWRAAVRARGPGGRRVHGRDDGPAGVRLAARQAHRHRRDPRAGAGAVPAGARRVRRRRHAHGAAVPPGRGPRRGLHRRAVLGAHPVDRDRVRHADPAVRPEADSRR